MPSTTSLPNSYGKSAWATNARLVLLGQVKVDAKSNEITAYSRIA